MLFLRKIYILLLFTLCLSGCAQFAEEYKRQMMSRNTNKNFPVIELDFKWTESTSAREVKNAEKIIRKCITNTQKDFGYKGPLESNHENSDGAFRAYTYYKDASEDDERIVDLMGTFYDPDSFKFHESRLDEVIKKPGTYKFSTFQLKMDSSPMLLVADLGLINIKKDRTPGVTGSLIQFGTIHSDLSKDLRSIKVCSKF